jgi:hypothetical protein
LPATGFSQKINSRMQHCLSKRWTHTVSLSTFNLQFDINCVQVSLNLWR